MKKLVTTLLRTVFAVTIPGQSRKLAYESVGHDGTGQSMLAGAQRLYRDVRKHVDGSERARKTYLAALTGNTQAPHISQRDGSMINGQTSLRTAETGAGELPDGSTVAMAHAFGQKVATTGEQRC